MPAKPSQAVIQLRISLQDVHPVVWRRLLVPGGVRLSKLHDMFQAAMGWTDSHLHSFRIGDELYGMQFDDYPEDEIDEKAVTVSEALRHHRQFVYEYDFGDSWEHDVVVEERTTTALGLKFAVCVDGQNACPPEDCGGSGGYARMLDALADPAHEEHDSYLKWADGPFDSTAFELAEANVALQRLR
ncbi:MAG TPA: plasmid pRiA4b ORF-3 family protein [Acidimicrobiales bacterium]|nr:plasmid pRiA4b ORF-3 family protein [Acidimicrobiales bacterium]